MPTNHICQLLRLSDGILKNICCLQKTHFKYKDTALNTKGLKYIPCIQQPKESQCNYTNIRQDFQAETLLAIKKEAFHKDHSYRGTYPPGRYHNPKQVCTQIYSFLKYIKQKLRELKEPVDKSIIILANFNTPFSGAHRKIR